MQPSLYTSFLTAHAEVPITAFALPVHINWFVPGVDPAAAASEVPFKAPAPWVSTPGQPIIGLTTAAAPRPQPWLYGETPDLYRLIGNAVPGYGA